MCLGIPGRVVGFPDEGGMFASVDVAGAARMINVALVRDDGVAVGDWVLIHMGFAMEVIDEREAERALAWLRLYAGIEDTADVGDGDS